MEILCIAVLVLEVAFLIWLCGRNKMRAMNCGAAPTKYVVITVLLWLIFGGLGGFIAFMLGSELTIMCLAALGAALIGCGLSNLISRAAR